MESFTRTVIILDLELFTLMKGGELLISTKGSKQETHFKNGEEKSK